VKSDTRPSIVDPKFAGILSQVINIQTFEIKKTYNTLDLPISYYFAQDTMHILLVCCQYIVKVKIRKFRYIDVVKITMFF
jgi:hypothetical protein